jgi:hypothetical protein
MSLSVVTPGLGWWGWYMWWLENLSDLQPEGLSQLEPGL